MLEIIERGAREGPVIFFLFFSLFQAFRTIWEPDSESSSRAAQSEPEIIEGGARKGPLEARFGILVKSCTIWTRNHRKKGPGGSRESPGGAEAPGRPQNGPKTAPKRPPGGPKTAPRPPPRGPQGAQEAPKRPQEAPKRPPRGPKKPPKRPRRPPRGPKRPPRGPKKPSWGPLGSLLRASWGPLEAARAQK